MIRQEPRRPLFEEYLIRLELALGAIGNDPISEIITSRDPRFARTCSELGRLAEEVRSWTPPFSSDDDLQTSVTIAGPGGDIGPTLHLDGDAVRFVLSGSVWFGGTELEPGDWMLIPAGSAYRLRVGYRGVISLTAVYRPVDGFIAGDAPKQVAIESWVE